MLEEANQWLIKKTHNILELKSLLEKNGISIELTEDECDFLDSIYLPTKYPMGSALPLLERRLNTPSLKRRFWLLGHRNQNQ